MFIFTIPIAVMFTCDISADLYYVSNKIVAWIGPGRSQPQCGGGPMIQKLIGVLRIYGSKDGWMRTCEQGFPGEAAIILLPSYLQCSPSTFKIAAVSCFSFCYLVIGEDYMEGYIYAHPVQTEFPVMEKR